MKRALIRQPVVFYYIITLVLSILLIIPHYIWTEAGNYSVSFTQFGPALAVVLFVMITKDKNLWINMKKKFAIINSLKWSIIITLATFILMTFIGFALTKLEIVYTPWKGTPVFYLLNIIAMFVCCIGEEIGWRGFLLPLLHDKYSLFKSSIIVGVLWGVWHLNFNSGLIGFLLFTVYITGFSVIMSWIYAKTKGNMNLMILLHFCFNLFSHVFLWNRFVIQLFAVEAIVFTLIAIVIVICNQKLFFDKKIVANEISMR